MDSNQPNQTAKSNWKQKGQGWIPDYPDLRDRRLIKDEELHQSGSLTQKDEGKDFELLDDVINAFLDVLQEISGKSGGEEFQNSLDNIKKKRNAFKIQLFGDITFLPVRAHRILRKASKSLSPYASSNFMYEDELPQRISELNMCLYLLYKSGQLTKEDIQKEDYHKLSGSKLIGEDFDLIGTLEWLRAGKFTQETEALVRAFQRKSKATVDGIVGLETYTAFKESTKTNGNAHYPSSKAQPNEPYTELVSLTPLLPQESIEDIFELLKSWAIKQISADLSKNFSNYGSECIDDDLYEIKTPEEIIGKDASAVNIFKETFKGDVDHFVKKLIEEKPLESVRADNLAEEIIEKILSEITSLKSEAFYELYRAEYLLLEPIVSIILKIIGPCGRFRNYPLKSILAKGIQAFETLMELPDSQEGNNKGIYDITENLNHDVTADLALQLLGIADNTLDFKLNSLVKRYSIDNLKTNKKTTLEFYFLIKKTIKWLKSKKRLSNETNSNNDLAFGREFHLHIIKPDEKVKPDKELKVKPDKELKVKPDKELNNEELVRFATLQIPVSTRQFYNSLEKQNLFDDTTPVPFTFLPNVVDLSYWCSEIEDQKGLNSCTAFAGIALLEYFANKSSGQHTDLSPLFLYKVTRTLLDLTDDIGASVRATMKAMVTFGVAPEEYWPYDADKVNEEPPAFCYSFAEAYKAVQYFRLDYAGISKENLLLQIKAVLSAGFPCMFGFTLYTSAERSENASQGAIPFPDYKKDKVVGGHAVVAVGYDDYKEIYRTDLDTPSIGALLIRNSLGTDWGCKGYGWLPYDYVLAGLTGDWWSLLKAEWFENNIFWVGNAAGVPNTEAGNG